MSTSVTIAINNTNTLLDTLMRFLKINPAVHMLVLKINCSNQLCLSVMVIMVADIFEYNDSAVATVFGFNSVMVLP